MTPAPIEGLISVLLVEDDPDDVFLTRQAIERNKLHLDLHVVSDGVEALAYLRQEGDFAGAERPDLILLDLNLPRLDGRAVLEQVKGDERLRDIPVVVLTTSQAEEDVLRSYHLHANCYVTKPIDLEQFRKVVADIEHFWFTVVRLPSRSADGARGGAGRVRREVASAPWDVSS